MSVARAGSRPLLSTVRVLRASSTPYLLSSLLVVVAAFAGALTWAVPGVLTGPADVNGSARGTALIVLVVAVPTLVLSMGPSSRGSRQALVIWLGTLAYLTYNAGLFLFGTPANQLLLLYLVMLTLSVFALVSVVVQAEPGAIHADRPLVRPIAVYIWVIVGLNALVWLAMVVPALLANRPGDIARGTGLATNPVAIQDLALHLPAMAVFASWLWHRRPHGVLLAGGGLVFWVLESISVSVDQWVGATTRPGAPLTSTSAAPLFSALALLSLVAAGFLLRGLRSVVEVRPIGVPSGTSRSRRPPLR
ncbi:MAG TPA: hypothetical protein VF635_07975 [Propionibacteriaceae bacterium]